MLILILLALSFGAFGADKPKEPKPVPDKDRASYAAAIARVAIAQAQVNEHRARMIEAQTQHEALMKALRAELDRIRKESGAKEGCELDLEGKWQCASASR